MPAPAVSTMVTTVPPINGSYYSYALPTPYSAQIIAADGKPTGIDVNSTAQFNINTALIYTNKNYIEHTLLDNADLQNDILNQSRKISDYIFFSISLIKDLIISLFLITTLFFINLKATFFFIILCMFLSLIFYLLTNKKIKYINKILIINLILRCRNLSLRNMR